MHTHSFRPNAQFGEQVSWASLHCCSLQVRRRDCYLLEEVKWLSPSSSVSLQLVLDVPGCLYGISGLAHYLRYHLASQTIRKDVQCRTWCCRRESVKSRRDGELRKLVYRVTLLRPTLQKSQSSCALAWRLRLAARGLR